MLFYFIEILRGFNPLRVYHASEPSHQIDFFSSLKVFYEVAVRSECFARALSHRTIFSLIKFLSYEVPFRSFFSSYEQVFYEVPIR